MPWNRNEPDPLEARRRQLEEQQRLLIEQRKKLTQELHQADDSSPGQLKRAEPPVWRMEEDIMNHRAAEPTPARKRNLAHQRRRDMIFAFILIVLFLIVLALVLWVAYVHNTTPVSST
jgi:lipopolysaccharide/colanic/teichoic acid biosynthesis glycosyltransferase